MRRLLRISVSRSWTNPDTCTRLLYSNQPGEPGTFCVLRTLLLLVLEMNHHFSVVHPDLDYLTLAVAQVGFYDVK